MRENLLDRFFRKVDFIGRLTARTRLASQYENPPDVIDNSLKNKLSDSATQIPSMMILCIVPIGVIKSIEKMIENVIVNNMLESLCTVLLCVVFASCFYLLIREQLKLNSCSKKRQTDIKKFKEWIKSQEPVDKVIIISPKIQWINCEKKYLSAQNKLDDFCSDIAYPDAEDADIFYDILAKQDICEINKLRITEIALTHQISYQEEKNGSNTHTYEDFYGTRLEMRFGKELKGKQGLWNVQYLVIETANDADDEGKLVFYEVYADGRRKQLDAGNGDEVCDRRELREVYNILKIMHIRMTDSSFLPKKSIKLVIELETDTIVAWIPEDLSTRKSAFEKLELIENYVKPEYIHPYEYIPPKY